MSSVMARLAAKRFGTVTSIHPDEGTPAEETTVPPFVASLLKQVGMDPAKIMADVKGYGENILETVSRIDARLSSIEGRLSDIESNQSLMMADSFRDRAAEQLAEKMVTETPAALQTD